MSHLHEFNKRGLFPAPGETEEAFLRRCTRSCVYFEGEPLLPEEREEANRLTEQLFDFSADWFAAYYSDEKLPFWQGAVAWADENGTPFVQLRKGFKKGRYLNLYSRKEVLAHEAVHAVRMGFNEPQFEELLAYQTSSSRWRRFLAPLFRAWWEPSIFLGLLLISLVGQILLFFWNYALFELLSFLPFLYLAWLFLRLVRTHWLFRSFLKRARAALAKPQQALALALRLTDREIVLFSKYSPKEISDYAHQEKNHSLRWKVVQQEYF